jgi:hypothetical protein
MTRDTEREGLMSDHGRPIVVCLCGSTRFRAEYERAFRDEEHAGRICLTVPCYKDDPCCKSTSAHVRLDKIHLRKIDMADEVLFINVGGYLGESTRRELSYAWRMGKRVRWLEPAHALPEPDCARCRGSRAYMITAPGVGYRATPCAACRPEIAMERGSHE